MSENEVLSAFQEINSRLENLLKSSKILRADLKEVNQEFMVRLLTNA